MTDQRTTASGEATLPPHVVEWLQDDRFIVVASVTPDGWPTTHVVSWAVALDDRTIRLSVRHASPTVENVRASGKIMLELVGDDLVLGVRGSARIVKELMESTPRENAVIEISVEQIISHLPQQMQLRGPSWGGPARTPEMEERLQQVLAELRNA